MELGWKKRMKKSAEYHWKIISLIIHLKINEYLLKYFHWHLNDIWFSLQSVSYISLKCKHSFQTVHLPLKRMKCSDKTMSPVTVNIFKSACQSYSITVASKKWTYWNYLWNGKPVRRSQVAYLQESPDCLSSVVLSNDLQNLIQKILIKLLGL